MLNITCDECGRDEFYLTKKDILESSLVTYDRETETFEEVNDKISTGILYELRCANCETWIGSGDTLKELKQWLNNTYSL